LELRAGLHQLDVEAARGVDVADSDLQVFELMEELQLRREVQRLLALRLLHGRQGGPHLKRRVPHGQLPLSRRLKSAGRGGGVNNVY